MVSNEAAWCRTRRQSSHSVSPQLVRALDAAEFQPLSKPLQLSDPRLENALHTAKWHFSITLMRTELVTTLKRKATELISEVSATREPFLITQHGLPAAYLVDVVSFESMEARIQLLEGIAKGEKAIFEGRVVSHEAAKTRMARWLD